MAVDKNGFIIVSRNICEHWVWSKTPVSWGQAWVDLLLMANYKARNVPYKGEVLQGEAGTVYRSIKWLSLRWGWSRDKTRNFLKLLENDGMIQLKADRHHTSIFIVNYGKFQHPPTTKPHQTDNKPTSDQHLIDNKPTSSRHQADIYNKDNKDNKDNKETKKIEPDGSEAEQEEPDWDAIWDSLPDIEGTGE